MSNDPFRKIEDQFYILKGQFISGRITQAQFDAALKALMLQDAQGRYWMIGADTGTWYVHDGQSWVEANPPGAGAPAGTTPRPATQPSRGFNATLLIASAAVVIVCLLGVLGTGLAMNQGILKVSLGQPTNTPLVIPTPMNPTIPVVPTFALPTALPLLTPTAAPIPTSTPRAEPTPTATTSPATATTSPATATTSPATATPPPAPGLYVTNLRMEPPNPGRSQDVGFFATFLNTANGDQNFRWAVYIFKADNLRNSFGETAALASTVPPGSMEIKSLGAWRTGTSLCDNFVARVGALDQNKNITWLNRTNGQVYELAFRVC